MAQNPQYSGKTPNFSFTPSSMTANAGSAVGGMSSTTPPTTPPVSMGTAAISPQTPAPSNSISPDQAKTPTAPSPSTQTASAGNTGLLGNPNGLFQSSAQGLYDMTKDPQLQQMLSEYNNIAQGQPQALTSIMNDTTRGIPQTVEQARIGATNDQYSQQLAAKSAQIQTYLQGKGLDISALQGAGSLAQPQNQLGFLTSPFTGQPIYGNGTLGGLSGLAYKAGQVQNAGNLGVQNQNQAIAIGNARGYAQQLQNILPSSGLNQSQYAAVNWLGNVAGANMSNPKLAPIQSLINNSISQYATATGQNPSDLSTQLLNQSGGQSIITLLQSLDNQATTNYGNTQNVATGGGITGNVPTPNSAPKEGDVHTDNSGTWKVINNTWVKQ